MLKLVIQLSLLLAVGLLEAALPFELARIKAHIDEKFAQAVVETDPYPHIVIRNILPQDVYDYLSSQWPAEEAFDYKSSSPLRMRLPITNGCVDVRPLSAEQKQAWSYFGEVVVNQHIKEKVKEAFAPFMMWKFSFLGPQRAEFAKANLAFHNFRLDGLNLDKPGYSLLPHIDHAGCVA